MNCLLLREMTLDMSLRLWDTYFAEGASTFAIFHVYVCAAVLSHFSQTLQGLDFQDLIVYLQHLQQHWGSDSLNVLNQVLAQAYVWMSTFEGAQNVLRT